MSTFDEAYSGVPPWDIGRPQAAFVSATERGEVKGDVIDVGCGTGEQAILFASAGHRSLGVDSSKRAIEKAKAKASKRRSSAEFLVWDALDLGSVGRRFDTATDSALFHVFSDSDRARYVRSLHRALRPGGAYLMLCFSDKEPKDWGGPRRVSKEEIETSFSRGWRVDSISPGILESNFHPHGGKAWFSHITRVP